MTSEPTKTRLTRLQPKRVALRVSSPSSQHLFVLVYSSMVSKS